jgi:TIR domain
MVNIQPDDRYDAFISYSRKDEEFVRNRLCPALESHDLRLWVDLGEIPPGADFDKRKPGQVGGGIAPE